jgi:hypothetical protein
MCLLGSWVWHLSFSTWMTSVGLRAVVAGVLEVQYPAHHIHRHWGTGWRKLEGVSKKGKALLPEEPWCMLAGQNWISLWRRRARQRGDRERRTRLDAAILLPYHPPHPHSSVSCVTSAFGSTLSLPTFAMPPLRTPTQLPQHMSSPCSWPASGPVPIILKAPGTQLLTYSFLAVLKSL